MDWIDGWPVFDEDRYDVPPAPTGFVDGFVDPRLHPRWVVPGGDPATTVEHDPAGGLRVLPNTASPDGSAGVVCTRVRDLRWSAEAALVGPGWFALRLDDRHAYGLNRYQDRVEATARIGDLDVVLGARPVPNGTAVLRLEAVTPAAPTMPLGDAGPDEIILSVVGPDGPHELARLDGRYLSTEVASGFTGRMLALGAATVPAHFRSIDYHPAP